VKFRNFLKKNRLLNKKIFFLFFLLLIIFLIHFNFFGIKYQIYQTYPNLELRKKLLSKNSVMNNLKNDYNVKFLPETQFLKLSFNKIKLNFSESLYLNLPINKYITFFIELLNDEIWIVDYVGNIYRTNIEKVKLAKMKNNNLDLKVINSNLSAEKVLDTLIDDQYIYIYFVKSKHNCKSVSISMAKIDSQYLNFENLYNSNECGNNIRVSRMQFYTHNDSKGLLFTTNNVFQDQPDKDLSQNENSIFGKIIFIDFETKNNITFSKGHRNSQGLYVENNLILSTDHGPMGGDEINKIIFNRNYGWPISSYGEKYLHSNIDKPDYLKDHKSLGFEEPIFSFVPAIGISEIIKLPNSFSAHYIDNFILSSLWGSSIYRIKFDENYDRIIFIEKIFIGQRIRDLKYHYKMNAIFLALENDNGELGILLK